MNQELKNKILKHGENVAIDLNYLVGSKEYYSYKNGFLAAFNLLWPMAGAIVCIAETTGDDKKLAKIIVENLNSSLEN